MVQCNLATANPNATCQYQSLTQTHTLTPILEGHLFLTPNLEGHLFLTPNLEGHLFLTPNLEGHFQIGPSKCTLQLTTG